MGTHCQPHASLPEILILTPVLYQDSRGFFLESYHGNRYAKFGIPAAFVQDNMSQSCRHTLRGLHYQIRHPQGKLIQVLTGSILDVAVDIRHGSPTFGQTAAIELTADSRQQVYVPPGYAHGFYVLSKTAFVHYKCTDYYSPADERGILWNDPALNIPWPAGQPLLSEKDMRHPRLNNVPPEDLPQKEE